MFKLVTGGNGRSVYGGVVTRRKENAIEIKGTEYNPDTRAEEERTLQLVMDPYIVEANKGIKEGDYIVAMVMPHRKIQNLGTAEEIAKENQAIEIVNDRGNTKLIVNARVFGKKWNQKHTVLRTNFCNIQDTDGNMVGNKSDYRDRFGIQQTTYWLSVNWFPPCGNIKNYYNADNVDRILGDRDAVVMVINKAENQYNGKVYINYTGAKYQITAKTARKNA